jgi:hypothetical protein
MSTREALTAAIAACAEELLETEDPAELIDLITLAEDLKSAACALQARATVAFAAVRSQEKAVVSEVALARRVSPHRGRTLVGLATILTTEMPCTLDRLADGSIDEWKAMILVRETACLEVRDRQTVDATLCGDPADLDGVGVRELERRVQQLAYELAPAAFVKRREQAVGDRHVSLRPAPDAMTYLTALLPLEQGVAVYKALKDAAASGAERADLLVKRVLGRDDTATTDVPVCVNITLPAESLAGGAGPALVEGHPMPAETARRLAGRAISSGVGAWFRRLYEADGRLVAMSSRSRFYEAGLADFLDQRDQGICRTPYCDAPVAHHDHVLPVVRGGPTTADNGQGLCVHCNQAKELAAWQQRLVEGRRHAVETTTSTGYRYRSTAPPLRHPHAFRVRLAADFFAA